MKPRILEPLLLLFCFTFFACEETCPLVEVPCVQPVEPAETPTAVVPPASLQQAVAAGVRVVSVTRLDERDLCDDVPDCGKALYKWSEQLQKEADALGEILYKCVDCCLDGYRVYITLVAYPHISVDTYASVNNLPASDNPDATQLLGIDYDLVISPCPKGRVFVQVKPHEGTTDDFYYKWKLNGEAIDFGHRTDCICGEKVSVGVSFFPGGKTLFKSAKLPVCLPYPYEGPVVDDV